MTTQISGTTGVNKVQDLVVTPEKLSQKLTLMTAVDLTSLGDKTKCDFTGIPSWARRITVTLSGVSVISTSALQLQIGTSSGVVTSGYLTTSSYIGTSVAVSDYPTGAVIPFASAAAAIRGSFRLDYISPNLWSITGSFRRGDVAATTLIAGDKTLDGVLDRVRITTVDGTAANNFDAGTINVLYEG